LRKGTAADRFMSLVAMLIAERIHFQTGHFAYLRAEYFQYSRSVCIS
jgi:hypothetical protein